MWQPVWTRTRTKLIRISCKKASKSFYSQSITLCSPVCILYISIALKQQPAFNCFAAAETTIIDQKSTYSNIFSSTETKIFIHGKYSFVSVSIIAWLACDINKGAEDKKQNLGSCQKVIPRRNIIIETANEIINKQGKSAMLDFFANCSDLCQLTVVTSRHTVYIS